MRVNPCLIASKVCIAGVKFGWEAAGKVAVAGFLKTQEDYTAQPNINMDVMTGCRWVKTTPDIT